MLKRKYKYFVSYRWNKGDETGFGRCDATLNTKIKDCEDIKKIEGAICEEHGFDKVIIVNYKKF